MSKKPYLVMAVFCGLAITIGITSMSHATTCVYEYKVDSWELELVDVTIDGAHTAEWDVESGADLTLERRRPDFFTITVEEKGEDPATMINFAAAEVPSELGDEPE